MMHKKDVEKYIAKAIKAAREHLSISGDPKSVNAEYDGYAASLGASIVTSGLKPALAFYSDLGVREGVARHKVLQAIAQILKEEAIFSGLGSEADALLNFVLKPENEAKQRQLKAKVLAASIALKLALRNFTQVKKTGQS